MSHYAPFVALSDEEEMRSQVVLDYTSRDFTAIRSQLVGLARGLMPEWETVGEASDFGTLLLELFAYSADVMHFYIDRVASEAFLATAQRRQSVLYIADMLGYRPIGQTAASVDLLFSLDANAEASVTLPAGMRVYNEADDADSLVVFELNTVLTLAPGDTDIPAKATEGVMVRDTLLGISLGTPNGEYIIQDKGVVFNTISVRSEEGGQTIAWDFVSDLSLARPTQPVFTTYLDDGGFTHVVFGDNSAGRIPPVNANLYVTYRYGVGARANALAATTINTISGSSAPNVDLWGVTVSNPVSPLGGTDPESVDSMRYSIPRASSRIKSRAVTLNDYADLAMQVPGVAKSVAHGTVYTAVHVRIAPQAGVADDAYMTQLCATVEDYMSDKVIVGSTVYAEPETIDDLWQNIYIRVLVHVTEGFNRTSVQGQVDTLLRDILKFDAVDFGWKVTIGRIYRATLAVQGVDWAEVRWLSTVPPTDEVDVMNVEGAAPEDSDSLLETLWHYSSNTAMADPGAGFYRQNNVANPTTFAFSNVDAAGGDHADTNTVTNKALTSNVATLTIGAHTIAVGEKVIVALSAADPVFDGTHTVTAVTGTTISYAKTNANVASAASGGTVNSGPLLLLKVGDHFMLHPPGDPSTWWSMVVTAAPTNNSTWVQVTAAKIAASAAQTMPGYSGSDDRMEFEFIRFAPDPERPNNVGDILTPPLLIPRIEPTEVTEDETDFPGTEEEDRHHDGLWVVAVGGVPGS